MPFDPFAKARIGKTNLRISRLGIGTAPLGGWPAPVPASVGIGTIRRAWEKGIRYFDTAPFYGSGQSETYIGKALEGLPRSQFHLSTKAGRLLVPGEDPRSLYHDAMPFTAVFDFSARGVEQSLAESSERLGFSADIVYLHDPDHHQSEAMETAYPKLAELRDEGRIKAIGVGMNWVEPLERFAEEGEFDVFLLAGRYSLLEQTALDRLFPVMAEKGMSVVAGGVFNSGLLIDPRRGSMYDYAAAPDDVVVKAQRLAMVCGKFGVPLRAAALQFAAAHPLVASVIVGARTVAEIDDTLELCALAIPHELWTKLKEDELIRADAPVPGN